MEEKVEKKQIFTKKQINFPSPFWCTAPLQNSLLCCCYSWRFHLLPSTRQVNKDSSTKRAAQSRDCWSKGTVVLSAISSSSRSLLLVASPAVARILLQHREHLLPSSISHLRAAHTCSLTAAPLRFFQNTLPWANHVLLGSGAGAASMSADRGPTASSGHRNTIYL